MTCASAVARRRSSSCIQPVPSDRLLGHDAIAVAAPGLRARRCAAPTARTDGQRQGRRMPSLQAPPSSTSRRSSKAARARSRSRASRIDYDAYAGTLVVHPKGWDDVPQNAPKDEDKNPRPEASMFYVAYFKTRRQGRGKSAGDKADDRQGRAAAADDLPVQRRSRLVQRLAAHGCLRATPRGDRR